MDFGVTDVSLSVTCTCWENPGIHWQLNVRFVTFTGRSLCQENVGRIGHFDGKRMILEKLTSLPSQSLNNNVLRDTHHTPPRLTM